MKESEFQLLLREHPRTLLYFYPKDNTPGCSLEARDFSQYLQRFYDQGIGVIGVSKDCPACHKGFIAQQELKIPLISDES